MSRDYHYIWQPDDLVMDVHESAKLERCVDKVSAEGDVDEPYAVCKASVGECTTDDCPCPGCQAKRDRVALLEADGILDVPDERQEENWSCGAACVAAVCHFFDVTPDTEGDAIRQLGSSPRDGTDPEHIVTVLQDHGLETTAISGMDLEDLEHYLAKGRPCICPVQAWGTPEEVQQLESGHYLVCIGADETHIMVMDPAVFDPAEVTGEYGGKSLGGQKVAVPRERFLAGWIDVDSEGSRYDRYAIVVRGPQQS